MPDQAPIEIRAARHLDAAPLSDLALRSKGHWGYPADFLEACRAELAVTAEQIDAGGVFVADRSQTVVGFGRLSGTLPHGELAALFVDLDAIGTGVGGRLLHHALSLAQVRGYRSLVLDADPGAEPFYLHHGAHRVGESPSGSIPGRLLPRLLFEVPFYSAR